MIERVAKAMADAVAMNYDHNEAIFKLYARTAIAAMREPTGAMAIDGSNTKVRVWDTAKETFLDDPQPVWRAMIDAAMERIEGERG
jgi:hypothetical protein